MGIQPPKADFVFEGGGVQGIGLVGALSVFEEEECLPVNVAGTSAGAIVATLLAAGYTAAEVKPIITNIDFNTLTDSSWIGRIPLVGAVIEELFEQGLYNGDLLLKLMRDLLAKKGVHTFRDLIKPEYANDERYRFKVRVVASDITQGRMLVLPQDISDYGMQPEDLEVALAVRMSMSIPFFFKPVKLANSYIVDGGLLSNFPVELFDSDGVPEWPTFGIKLVQSDQANSAPMVRHPIHGPFSELAALFFTAQEAHDAYYLKNDKFVRTTPVDTLDIAATDFNLKPEQKEGLYQSGVKAAKNFIANWDFEKYKAMYRSGQPVPSRSELVWSAAPLRS
jgi:NTE family protein